MLTQLRDITVSDLLGREEVRIGEQSRILSRTKWLWSQAQGEHRVGACCQISNGGRASAPRNGPKTACFLFIDN
jgi:hypothetical protein